MSSWNFLRGHRGLASLFFRVIFSPFLFFFFFTMTRGKRMLLGKIQFKFFNLFDNYELNTFRRLCTLLGSLRFYDKIIAF